MDPRALREAIDADTQRGLCPLLIVGTAGTTGGGIVDPLADLADVAAASRTWLHVDAAWGGAAALVPRLRPPRGAARPRWSLGCGQTVLPLVCFTHEDIRTGQLKIDAVVRLLQDRGRVWISDVVLGQRERVLRACITSFRTDEEDLDVLVDEIEHARRHCLSSSWT
jgi:hypothetical protein